MQRRIAWAAVLVAASLAGGRPTSARADDAAEKPAERTLAVIRKDVDAAARAFGEKRLAALAGELASKGGDGTSREATVLRLRAVFHEANILRFRRKVQDHERSSEFKERQVEIAAAAEELAAKLLETSPDDVDVLALHGELIALQITGPNGALIGPRAAASIERALALSPDHVAAHLASGRRYLYTPGAFGGSDATANEHLQKAEKILNARERKLLLERREKALEGVKDAAKRKQIVRELVTKTRSEVWHMNEEVLVHLAVTYTRQGRTRRAKVALRRALAANAKNAYAAVLLKRIEDAEKKQAKEKGKAD